MLANGPIAQLAEQPAHNRSVPGSNPGGPTSLRVARLKLVIINFIDSTGRVEFMIKQKIIKIPEYYKSLTSFI